MTQPDSLQTPEVPAPLHGNGWNEPVSRHLRLELVTDGRRLVGVVQHPTVARLVDLLNWSEETALALADVDVTPLELQGEAAHRLPQAHVRRQAIAFAIPREDELTAVSRRPLDYVEKRPWRVSALLPRFLVSGHLHLSPAADPTNASLFWNAGFVALTDAEAVFLPNPAMTWKATVIIVNSARAEAYCPPAVTAQA